MIYKTYIIEGKIFTAVGLAKEMNVSQQTARNRLRTASTIEELYRPLYKTKCKTHIIEGKKFTSELLAKKLDCSKSLARARLNTCNTIKELTKPISKQLTKEQMMNVYSKETNKEKELRKLMLGAW